MVSIIIPFFNSSDYLLTAIKSASNQTYKDLEIILVNDGSTDSSLEIAKMASLEDSRIKIFNLKKIGLPGARRAGVQASLGEYIYFLDSDDFLEIHSIDKLCQTAYENEADIVIGEYTLLWLNKNKKEHIKLEGPNEWTSNEFICWLIEHGNMFLCGKLIKKELYNNPIIFPENISYGEDNIGLSQLVSYSKRIAKCGSNIFFYTQREGSISNSNNNLRNVELLHSTYFVYNFWNNLGRLNVYEKNYLSFWLIRGVITHIRLAKPVPINISILSEALKSKKGKAFYQIAKMFYKYSLTSLIFFLFCYINIRASLFLISLRYGKLNKFIYE